MVWFQLRAITTLSARILEKGKSQTTGDIASYPPYPPQLPGSGGWGARGPALPGPVRAPGTGDRWGPLAEPGSHRPRYPG